MFYHNHAIAEMCYPSKFLWLEREEPELTIEQQMVQYYDDQWYCYKELWDLVQQNGGEILIDGYMEFLLDQLQDGPYWEEMREQFGTFRVTQQEPEPEPEPEPQPEPEPESDSDSDIEWIYLNDIIKYQPNNGA